MTESDVGRLKLTMKDAREIGETKDTSTVPEAELSHS